MRFTSLVVSSLLTRSAQSFAPATTSASRGILHHCRNAFHTGSNSNSNSRSSSRRLYANVVKLSDPQRQLLDQVDVFIFDCDGVIWRGDTLIAGVPETLQRLRSMGKRMFFVTNNSTKSRQGYKTKFDSLLGLNVVHAEEIFSSSFAAAAYLEQVQFAATGQKVYVIGEIGICQELDLLGIPYLGGPEDKGKAPNMGPGDMVHVDESVGAVIVGFDRHINYYKIQYAQLCINEHNAAFIATNLDAVTHLTDAQEWAGNGSMVGAIKGCTGREPIVVGKPSPLMIEYLETKYGVNRSRICMVGDRLDTDVLFGTDNGLMSLLVLSGVTSETKLLSDQNHITPDYYTDTINDFFVPPPAPVTTPPPAAVAATTTATTTTTTN